MQVACPDASQEPQVGIRVPLEKFAVHLDRHAVSQELTSVEADRCHALLVVGVEPFCPRCSPAGLQAQVGINKSLAVSQCTWTSMATTLEIFVVLKLALC